MRHGQTELIMISIYIKACKKSSEITKIKKDSLYLRVVNGTDGRKTTMINDLDSHRGLTLVKYGYYYCYGLQIL